MKKILFITSSLISIFCLISCLSCRKVESKTERMSLREKLGQMFVIRPESLDPSYSVTEVHQTYGYGSEFISPEMIETYKNYPAGGVILFPKNIINPEQTKNLTSQIHALNTIPTFIYVDEEGGPVTRVSRNPEFNLPVFKDMKTIGETGDPEVAYRAGRTIGSYLKEYGFDVDFAPVADVDTNPDNPIIGRRAFSSNPNQAAKMDSAFYKGLKAEGIFGCYKHFPGHGDTQTDTHKGYTELNKSWKELLECEIIPFKAGIAEKINFIMISHITCPKVDSSGNPTTFSKVLLQDKLRKELKYEGIIITDSMEMGAILNEFDPAEAAIQSILAGADIILIPYNYTKTFDAVEKAVKEGRISEKRINESVSRILKVKGLEQN